MEKKELRIVLGQERLVTICPTRKAKGSRSLLVNKSKRKSRLGAKNFVAKQERMEENVFAGIMRTQESCDE